MISIGRHYRILEGGALSSTYVCMYACFSHSNIDPFLFSPLSVKRHTLCYSTFQASNRIVRSVIKSFLIHR